MTLRFFSGTQYVTNVGNELLFRRFTCSEFSQALLCWDPWQTSNSSLDNQNIRGGIYYTDLIPTSVSRFFFDRYGRKTIFYISGILQLIAGLSVAFIPNFIAYCGFLFFYGMFGSGGAYVTGFVLSKSPISLCTMITETLD